MIIKTRPLFTAAAVALVSMTLVADVANAQSRQHRPAAKQTQSIDRSSRNTNRHQNVRQDHRADKRRQDVRQDRRSDNRKDIRHDNRRDDRFDDRRDRREWREGRYNDFRRDYWRRRIVRRLITMPLHHAIVHHNSYTYYVVEGEYYTLENGVYNSVEPSIGVIVTTLPSAHQNLIVGGVPHFYHAGIYYRRHARGYISVRL